MPGHLKTLTFLLFAVLPVVADQSAVFSSRATQGLAWTGLSQVIREKITVTVQPDHLDVEHELEIDARSNWNTPNNPNSLEITGQLTLEKGTVVTGLLLWNGNVILKGKLRTREMARQQYEEVVDRNVTNPPPPRDPALLEKVGENRYDLSIFPVALNGSRKLRLRYLIPTRFEEGTHRSRFPHAFSRLASVTLRGGSGIQGYALTSVRQDGSLFTVKNEDDITSPLTLDPDAYKQFQPYNYWLAGTGSALRFVTPLFGDAYGSRVFLGSMEGVHGHAAHYIFRPPQDITGMAQETTTRIVALVKTKSDSVGKEVALNEMASSGLEELRIFSASAFEDSITWRAYAGDSIAKEVIEKPRSIVLSDGHQFLRTFGHTPFYPMTKTMPASLAASWGFIDAKYALLALEQDTLPTAQAKEYAAAGVPGLNASDIYPEAGALDSIPLSAWLLQRNISREELLGPTSVITALGLPAGIRWLFRDGALLVEIDPEMRKRDLRITLHGLDGRLLKQWNGGEIGGGQLNWFPKANGYGFGTCLLRITSGNQTWSARVTLR
jgi:hypothetical protein